MDRSKKPSSRERWAAFAAAVAMRSTIIALHVYAIVTDAAEYQAIAVDRKAGADALVMTERGLK